MPKVAASLWAWSEAYAEREIICKLSETPFDTSELDRALREGGVIPVTVSKTVLTFYPQDKSFSIDTADKELRQQMEQMKKDGEK